MTSITKRIDTLTKKAARLRGQYDKSVQNHDSLVARLAAGDEKVATETLLFAEKDKDRLWAVLCSVDAQLAEAEFLASHVGPDEGWSGLNRVVKEILDPLGVVKIVTPDDDIDGADIYVSQFKRSRPRLGERSYNLRTRTWIEGDPILDGRVLGEVSIIGRNLSIDAVKDRFRGLDHLEWGWHIHTYPHSHGEWKVYRLIARNVYPDVPPADQVWFIGHQNALASLSKQLVEAIEEHYAVGNVRHVGDPSRRPPFADRTSIESQGVGARFDRDSVDGTTRTIVGSVDIHARRVRASVGDDEQVEQIVRKVANDALRGSVACVGRVTDVSVSMVGGDGDGQVYRVTVTGISHVPESADTDAAAA